MTEEDKTRLETRVEMTARLIFMALANLASLLPEGATIERVDIDVEDVPGTEHRMPKDIRIVVNGLNALMAYGQKTA